MLRTRMIVLAALLGFCQLGEAMDYHVSPNGSDTGAGTAAAPFATLARARDAIGKSGQAGKQAITVHLADGTYFLGETFTLKPQDSGSAEAPITYRAATEDKAILSGAVELKGLKWQAHGKGIHKAVVPAGLTKRCALDELWIGEMKLDMARYPNRSEHHVFGGVTNLKVLNTRAKSYRHPETGFVHALHRNHWGSVHYHITGGGDDGLQLAGGWQQNRHRQLNASNVMIENVFEELDHPGEWFLDRQAGVLYVFPPAGVDLDAAVLHATNLRELISFEGSRAEPVRHVNIAGIQFRHARRLFHAGEKAWEPLVRGDWSVVRSAAVLMTGTEHCTVKDCHFNATGGNGVFFNNYNRKSAVIDSLFERLGDSAVCFVGNYACARSNPICYDRSLPQSEMDLTPGPKGEDYPAGCSMDGCLVFAIGRVGKQTAGAFISMAKDIAVRRNTIYHVPRSGITVNDGCWGGHVIEHNDVFDTVIETGDHGPFNSWGRDRYWDTRHHSGKRYREDIPTTGGEKTPQTVSRDRARLDVVKPIVIRHNRFMHSWKKHSWGIDLDDGSSNYHVYNNLGLGCSIKLREGFFRRVYNNVFVGSQAIQIHVPFDYHSDYICRNIIVSGSPVTMPWRNDTKKIADAERIADNLYWSVKQYTTGSAENAQLARHQAAGIDANSVSADPKFVDPMNYDFRVADDSPALRLGFKNFPMDGFGVTKPALKKLADEGHRKYQKFQLADVFGQAALAAMKTAQPTDTHYTILGAEASDLDTEQEKSVVGIGELTGVFIVKVPPTSAAAKSGIRPGDAILAVDGKAVANCKKLLAALARKRGKTVELTVAGATDRKIKVKLD